MTDGSSAASFAHELRQPLNIIRLACGNIQARLLPALGREDAAYLESKLSRIEQQIARMAELISTRSDVASNNQVI